MQRNIRLCTLSVLALAVMLGLACTANAATTFTHVGLNDPTGEDWTFLGAGTYAVGPGANDGQDYWPIDGTGQENGGYVGYRASGTTVEGILNGANSWFMTATVKVVTADPLGEINAPFFGVRDFSNWWQLSMIDTGVVETTGVYIQDATEAALLVEAVDISAYNTYKMVYDPTGGTAGTGSIDVTVNGGAATTYARADVFAYPNIVNVNFGDFNSNPGGSLSHWNAVEFSSESDPPQPPENFVHTGTNNPITEGWSTLVTGGSSYEGTDEMDHWEIDSANVHCFRANGLTNSFAQNIIDSPDGWQFEATVKVVEPLPELNTVMMRVTDNLGDPAAADFSTRGAWGDTWAMNLMTDPEGDPNKTGIWIQTMATEDDAVFLTAVDITEYHDYGMIMTRGATMQRIFLSQIAGSCCYVMS